jgi:RimJ/RimL family protein N-acetyltransferase/SAM-dependent methyltransferase
MTRPLTEALPREGARVLLRRLRSADLAAFQAYRHDPAVGRYQGWTAQSDPAARAFLEEMQRVEPLLYDAWTQLAIARREDDALIGDIGIRLAADGSEAEVGFTLGRTAQRQGLATEAVTIACALVFELTPARRILAVIDARNTSAIRLVERVGMRRVATSQALFRDEPCVEHTYELGRSTAFEPAGATPAWSEARAAAQGRHAARYDEPEARSYAGQPGLGTLSEDDQDAYLADILRVCPLQEGMRVLDVGAGTGALTGILMRLPGLALTALEPSPAMLAHLRSRPELSRVTVVAGHCDDAGDVDRFDASSFDVVAARQVVNGLFDPLMAFRHWHRWLRPGGAVVVIEGLYGRDAWRGAWSAEVDVLPLSAVQTMATVPYLLESSGFRVETVERMRAVNALPVTRTPRYVVVARR